MSDADEDSDDLLSRVTRVTHVARRRGSLDALMVPVQADKACPLPRSRTAAQLLQLANARTKRQKLISERTESQAVALAAAVGAQSSKTRGLTKKHFRISFTTSRRGRRRIVAAASRDLAKEDSSKAAHLTAQEDLDIAFLGPLRASDVAHACRVSPPTVKALKIPSFQRTVRVCFFC